MEKYSILNKINEINDLKNLEINEINQLCEEVRHFILNKVSEVGGHLSPNLGIVELTVALHYVFNSPIDKIVWDVSHQCYPHKILTGRKEAFNNFKMNNDISGYTNKDESKHDLFNVGHTSTAISLASGLAKARDIKGIKENIIAVVGDGSLSGGEAFEGLNNAGNFNSNFIVVINDNEMSIGENQGSLYNNLAKLRDSNGTYENNFFKALGFEYIYLEEGNDVEKLVKVFTNIKDYNKPIVVHIHTKKGKGYDDAENNPERYHFTTAFELETGKSKHVDNDPTYNSIIADYIYEKTLIQDDIVVLNAATCGLAGLNKYKKDFPNRFFDVGIAEEHLIAFASGLASQNIRPIAMFASSFIQRAYDQIHQDLCLNNNPALIMVENAGISSSDMTHVGMYDIPMLSNIPNFVYVAPINDIETKLMIDWALVQNFPVGIRTPRSKIYNIKNVSLQPIELNKYDKVISGKKVAVIGLGNFYSIAEEVIEKLSIEKQINATLINPRFITNVDEELLNDLLIEHEIVITIEDGILDGGFGEKVTRFYGNKKMKVYNFGAKKEFLDRVPYEELLKKYNLRSDDIIKVIGV